MKPWKKWKSMKALIHWKGKMKWQKCHRGMHEASNVAQIVGKDNRQGAPRKCEGGGTKPESTPPKRLNVESYVMGSSWVGRRATSLLKFSSHFHNIMNNNNKFVHPSSSSSSFPHSLRIHTPPPNLAPFSPFCPRIHPFFWWHRKFPALYLVIGFIYLLFLVWICRGRRRWWPCSDLGFRFFVSREGRSLSFS